MEKKEQIEEGIMKKAILEVADGAVKPEIDEAGKMFYDLLDRMKEIHDMKRHDYASGEDRFSNLRLSEMMGIPAWKGALVRISDKFSRVAEFATKEELKVKDESIEDTLLDMANYCLIALILYRQRKK